MHRDGTTSPFAFFTAYRAYTLLELLVCLSILALLFALLAPVLAATRSRADRTRCLAHLHTLSAASAAYAVDDARNLLLPAHPVADNNSRHDEGFYDYGGATGSPRLWAGARYGPISARAAPTRPLNQYIHANESEDSSRAFQCPADRGLSFAPHSTLLEGETTALAAIPFHQAVGTSYTGNAYRGYGSDDSGVTAFWSVGPFLRPSTRITASSEVVLYSEAALWESLRREPASGGWVYTSDAAVAWHGDGRFTLAYVDGHADSPISTDVVFTSGSPSADPAHWKLQIRRHGTRFDCRPDALIPDAPGVSALSPNEETNDDPLRS